MISERLKNAIEKYEKTLVKKIIFTRTLESRSIESDFDTRLQNLPKINWMDLFGVERRDLEDFLIQKYNAKNYLELYEEHPPSKKIPKERWSEANVGHEINLALNRFEQRLRGETFYINLQKAVEDYKKQLATAL